MKLRFAPGLGFRAFWIKGNEGLGAEFPLAEGVFSSSLRLGRLNAFACPARHCRPELPTPPNLGVVAFSKAVQASKFGLWFCALLPNLCFFVVFSQTFKFHVYGVWVRSFGFTFFRVESGLSYYKALSEIL